MPGPAPTTSAAPTRSTGSTSTRAAGPATFTYDANGNLTSDGTTTLTYDVENRLVGRVGRPRPRRCATTRSGRLWQVTGGAARPRGSSTTATRWSRNITRRARCSAATSTAPAPTIRWSGTRAPALTTPPLPLRRPPGLDRRGRRRRRRRRRRSTPTTNGASPAPTNQRAGSNIPARPGSPSSACITTRPGSTRRRWGGSCRPIRSGMRIRSTSMPMSGTIRSMGLTPRACGATHARWPANPRPALEAMKALNPLGVRPSRAAASMRLDNMVAAPTTLEMATIVGTDPAVCQVMKPLQAALKKLGVNGFGDSAVRFRKASPSACFRSVQAPELQALAQ